MIDAARTLPCRVQEKRRRLLPGWTVVLANVSRETFAGTFFIGNCVPYKKMLRRILYILDLYQMRDVACLCRRRPGSACEAAADACEAGSL